jgi:hypothetical protein
MMALPPLEIRALEVVDQLRLGQHPLIELVDNGRHRRAPPISS